jgi:hypothetical protein
MQVVLYDQGSPFHKNWSEQFVKYDPNNRKRIGMSGSESAAALVQKIINATDRRTGAGGGGTLVFAVGHGGAELSVRGSAYNAQDATALANGMVDLAPGRKVRLARGGQYVFVDPFYNWVFQHPGVAPKSDRDIDQSVHPGGYQARLHNWDLYQKIGAAMTRNGVYKVIFLTCRIGNALNFVKKIALDWKVLVQAYNRYVWFVGSSPVRVCLDGDENGGGTNNAAAAYTVPQVDFVTVGPPLPAKP